MHDVLCRKYACVFISPLLTLTGADEEALSHFCILMRFLKGAICKQLYDSSYGETVPICLNKHYKNSCFLSLLFHFKRVGFAKIFIVLNVSRIKSVQYGKVPLFTRTLHNYYFANKFCTDIHCRFLL